MSRPAAAVLLACVALALGPALLGGRETLPAWDTAFTIVSLEHLLRGGGDWTRSPLAWPLARSVTQADVLVGPAALSWPLRAAGIGPYTTHLVVIGLGVALTAVAFHRLAVALVGPGLHAAVAGVVAACGPMTVAHLHHVNLVHHAHVAVAALALGAGFATARPVLAAVGGAVAALGFHFGVYAGAHGLLVAAITAAAAAARFGGGRVAGAALAGFVAGAATVAPIAAVWWEASRAYDASLTLAELRADAWRPLTTLWPLGGPLHAPLRAVSPPPDPAWVNNPPNPGYLTLALAIAGVALARRAEPRWAWRAVLVVLLASLLLACGPALQLGPWVWPLPYRAVAEATGLDALRAPARWLWVAHAALGLYAALAARAALARWPRVAPLAWALPVLVVLETPPPRTAPWSAIAPEPVYAALADIDVPGALYDEILRHDGRCDGDPTRALRAALDHRRPLFGRTYARFVPAAEAAHRVAGGFPSPEATHLLRAIGVRVVLEHPPLGRAAPDADCRVIDDHRLCVMPPPYALPDADTPAGDVVTGFRFARDPGGEAVALRCGEHVTAMPLAPWRAVRALRGGPLVVAFPSPCAADAAVDAPAATPIGSGPAQWPPRPSP